MQYRYNINSGITPIKRKIKKYVFGVAASLTMVGGFALPTFAAAGGASGDYCGASANGCAHATEAGAQCGSGAASGAFGAFGKDNNLAGGANGQQTGLSNSAVCGNRQGNL
jgi:hypothetical protein